MKANRLEKIGGWVFHLNGNFLVGVNPKTKIRRSIDFAMLRVDVLSSEVVDICLYQLYSSYGLSTAIGEVVITKAHEILKPS
jgi:hypothetical protein